MKAPSYVDFIDAVREFLGLRPIPSEKVSRAERPQSCATKQARALKYAGRAETTGHALIENLRRAHKRLGHR